MRFPVLEPPRTYVNEKTLHRVCHAGETVHGRTLRKDEVAIHVTALLRNYAVVHPSYEYLVDSGGFTAWWRVHCTLQDQEKQKSTE